MTTFYSAAGRAVHCRAELVGAGSTAHLPSQQGAATPQSPWRSVCLLQQEPCGVRVWSPPCSHCSRFGWWDREGWAAGPVPARTVDAPALSFLWAKAECCSPVEGVKPFQKQQNWTKLVQDRSCRKRRESADVFFPALPQTHSGLPGETCFLTLPGDNWGSPSLSWFCLASCGPCPTVCKKRD